MLTLFWDEWGVILEPYMPRGNTVNSATYADLLKNHLCPAIKSKQGGLLSTSVLLQHDNARPHTACSTVGTIQHLSFECLLHPPYSPDLGPSDFHVFGPLKEAMGGNSFRSDEEVQQAMHEWLRSQPKGFFSRGIHALLKLWNTCMLRNGDYVGKWSHCVPFVFNKLWNKKCLRFSFNSPMYKNGLSDAMKPVIPSCNKHAKIKTISSVNCLLKITNSLLWKASCTHWAE
jgi:histone-lysine N-methyltransferase SETMAR